MKTTLIALAATVVAVHATVTASAQTNSPKEHIFRYRVGEVEVVLLSEGQSEGDTRILLDAPAQMTAPYLSEDGTYATATNAFAVVGPEGTLLIDAGVGRRLTENLATAGIEKIDTIYLTHLHGDHIGGLLRDGARAFEGVPLALSAVEAEYWRKHGGNAARVLDLYETVATDPVAPESVPADADGVFAVDLPGHTPGHTAFLVVSDGERLLIWGDVAHAMAIQMPLPGVSVRYDVDPDAARASRLRILRYVAAHKIPVAGMHIPYPGIGTVEKVDEGYKFTPVAH